MQIKVDPRTGIIVQGARRPISPMSSSPVTRSQRARYRASTQAPQIDLQQILLVAKKIGKVIAEEMKKGQQSIIVQSATPSFISQGLTIDTEVQDIKIDESLIDVGIGETAQLVKGEESGILAKKETQTDKQLNVSKNKLRSLKGK